MPMKVCRKVFVKMLKRLKREGLAYRLKDGIHENTYHLHTNEDYFFIIVK